MTNFKKYKYKRGNHVFFEGKIWLVADVRPQPETGDWLYGLIQARSLSDEFLASEFQVVHEADIKIICPRCDGKGYGSDLKLYGISSGLGEVPCWECEGTGFLED